MKLLSRLFLAALLSASAAHANSLTLSLGTNVISEAAGPAATIATANIDTPLTNDLTLLLRGSDATKIYVAFPVTLPAGSNSVTFPVDSVNNGDIDGDKAVTLTIGADGFNNASASLTVTDDDTVSRRTLGGHLSGTIAGTNSYIVLDTITVDASRTLTIQPGSQLEFSFGKGITNQGDLVATGLPESQIVFTTDIPSPTNGSWLGIVCNGTTSPYAALNYNEIAFAQTGLLVNPQSSISEPGAVTISHSAIHHSTLDGVRVDAAIGFFFWPQAVQILQSAIYDNTRNGVYLHASAAGCDGPAPGSTNWTDVVSNEVFANGNAGIAMRGDASDSCTAFRIANIHGLLSDNFIHGNLYGIYGYAVNASGILNGRPTHNWGRIAPLIVNNIIANNTKDGIQLTNVAGADLLPTVVNNTIAENGGAGLFHSINFTNDNLAADLSFKFVVENNLLMMNGTGVQAQSPFDQVNATIGGTNILLISNNAVFESLSANWSYYPSAYGTPSTTNENGASADAHLNIAADPLFVSAADFHLQPGSPTIDAGTTNLAPASDFAGASRHGHPDIGAYEFGLALTANMQTNGAFGILINGGRGTPFTIEASTDMTSWVPLNTGTLTNRSLSLNVAATNASQFYRAFLH